MNILKTKDGHEFKVSEQDIDRVRIRSWYFNKKNGYIHSVVYCGSKNGVKRHKTIYLHRFLINPPDGLYVDHINGDKSDNQIENLRICTPLESACHCKKRKSVKSTYKGVYRVRKRWIASVQKNGRKVYFGSYLTEKEAAMAYDVGAIKLHHAYRSTNFPTMGIEELKNSLKPISPRRFNSITPIVLDRIS